MIKGNEISCRRPRGSYGNIMYIFPHFLFLFDLNSTSKTCPCAPLLPYIHYIPSPAWTETVTHLKKVLKHTTPRFLFSFLRASGGRPAGCPVNLHMYGKGPALLFFRTPQIAWAELGNWDVVQYIRIQCAARVIAIWDTLFIAIRYRGIDYACMYPPIASLDG